MQTKKKITIRTRIRLIITITTKRTLSSQGPTDNKIYGQKRKGFSFLKYQQGGVTILLYFLHFPTHSQQYTHTLTGSMYQKIIVGIREPNPIEIGCKIFNEHFSPSNAQNMFSYHRVQNWQISVPVYHRYRKPNKLFGYPATQSHPERQRLNEITSSNQRC